MLETAEGPPRCHLIALVVESWAIYDELKKRSFPYCASDTRFIATSLPSVSPSESNAKAPVRLGLTLLAWRALAVPGDAGRTGFDGAGPVA